ncbi:MAG: PilZ domain-containing protein [Sandaracinaceae bacterium]|nr:PilZ domain-containing protein [Sandaracinaceae bacterium]
MSKTTVEILPGERRAVRRAVALECSVLSDHWDEPVPFLLTDLSPFGAWLETSLPLEPGDEVLLSFLPPRQQRVHELLVTAKVARAALRRRREDGVLAGMGVHFEDLSPTELGRLTQCLHGLPPPLAGYGGRQVPPQAQGLEWIDVGDPVDDDRDIFALSEEDIVFLPEVQEEDSGLHALAPLMTGGNVAAERRRYRRAS